MNKESLGLYLHIPFCQSKCKYCDFCSFPKGEEEKKRYVAALIKEIESAPEDARETHSIFFGGGTPTLLSATEFCNIFSILRKKYRISADAEITVEANPGTVTKEKLSVLLSLGVNRISMGLQSTNDRELSILGRIHTYDTFLESYRLLSEVGFENVNIDLMYAIPEQTVGSFEETLRRVIALNPAHISAYSLIIEDGTPFGKARESLVLPSEEEETRMYESACRLLCEAGYNHYEISNYARKGRICRHNLRYWQGGDYLGFGLAAHSLYRGKRFANTEDFASYISDPASGKSCQARDLSSEAEEYVMLGLRTAFGISLSEYRARFCEDFLLGREEKLKLYEKLGYLLFEGDNIRLTEKGFYVSNAILCEIL